MLNEYKESRRQSINLPQIKEKLQWLKVKEEQIKESINTSTNKQVPESLWNKYKYRSAYSNYETRNCKDLQIPRLRTEHAKKGFYYSALKAWNDVPANIREIQTFGRFKKELKAHLTS